MILSARERWFTLTFWHTTADGLAPVILSDRVEGGLCSVGDKFDWPAGKHFSPLG